MKIDKTKLYAGMTLEDRAKLAFKFIVANDEAGYDDILATIPRQIYTMNDPNFTMPTTGLYYTAIMWGFEYQKEQGLNLTYLGMLSIIDDKTNDTELKQKRIDAEIKYLHSCDRLEILFSLLDELDKSHGLDTKTVYALAEVRCIAVGNNILIIDGELPSRTPQVLNNPDAKNKNLACKDYYLKTKRLFLTQLNEYQKVLGNKTDSGLEAENEILKAKLKKLEALH